MNAILNNFWILVLIIALAPAVSMHGQETVQRSSSDHLSMHIRFRADSTLQVRATYRVETLKSKEAYFLLNPGYPVEGISSDKLLRHEIAMKENRPFPFYKLYFDRNTGDEGAVEVKFDYTIDLKSANHITSNWLEFNVDQLWFPKYEDIDRKLTWDVTIEGLYKDYSVVTYDFDRVIRYRTIMQPNHEIYMEQKQPTLEVYLMMARDMVLWKNPARKTGVPVEFFVHREVPEALLLSMDEKVNTIITFFNKGFGSSNQIEKYLVVLRNTDAISFLQSRGEILLANIDDSDSYAALSHEVAHFWWMSADFINEPWMNESFANYSMFLILDTFDNASLAAQLERSRKKSENTVRIKEAGSFPKSNMNAYYHKGAVLLWELERAIGRESFLKLLAKRVTGNVNSTRGFLALLEEQEGKKVRDEFEAKL